MCHRPPAWHTVTARPIPTPPSPTCASTGRPTACCASPSTARASTPSDHGRAPRAGRRVAGGRPRPRRPASRCSRARAGRSRPGGSFELIDSIMSRLRGADPGAARGARPRVQRHQLLQADRVGHPRAGRRRRPGGRRCSPTSRWSAAPPASSTATPASASPPATTPRSAGRCCAAWPRPSTTCSPARRSPARRPSASAWCRCASTTTEVQERALEVAVAARRGRPVAPSAGPSTRSTTGTGPSRPSSTPRWRTSSTASAAPTPARAWPPTARSAPRLRRPDVRVAVAQRSRHSAAVTENSTASTAPRRSVAGMRQRAQRPQAQALGDPHRGGVGGLGERARLVQAQGGESMVQRRGGRLGGVAPTQTSGRSASPPRPRAAPPAGTSGPTGRRSPRPGRPDAHGRASSRTRRRPSGRPAWRRTRPSPRRPSRARRGSATLPAWRTPGPGPPRRPAGTAAGPAGRWSHRAGDRRSAGAPRGGPARSHPMVASACQSGERAGLGCHHDRGAGAGLVAGRGDRRRRAGRGGAGRRLALVPQRRDHRPRGRARAGGRPRPAGGSPASGSTRTPRGSPCRWGDPRGWAWW